jgi:hypothetical protein
LWSVRIFALSRCEPDKATAGARLLAATGISAR